MSGQSATVAVATETSTQPDIQASANGSAAPPPLAADPAAEPEVTIQDVLVEDVSIDGMCGVY